jgi:hypothetical protein
MFLASSTALLLLVQVPLGVGPRTTTVAEMLPRFGQAPAGGSRDVASPNPLLTVFLRQFRERNPAIGRGGLIELRQASPGQYIAIAWGTTEDQVFRGRFEDWLFGVFVVDATLTRVERVLEIMPTPRWGDFEIGIATLTADRVTVFGRGGYSDNDMRRVFEIGPPVSPEVAEADRKVVRLPPSSFPQLPRVVRRQLEADGCRVPQSPTQRGRHNVISGQFAAIGQRDWAILCSIDGQPMIRIYWGGYATCRGPVVEWIGRDWALLDIPDLRWRTVIGSMSARQALTAAEAIGEKLMAPTHEAIFERYCQNGKWLNLHATP